MQPALWTSKSGLDGQQTELDNISNNLANVKTPGYKKGRVQFEDLLYQKVRAPGAENSQSSLLPSGLMVGTGVKVVSTQKDFSNGNPIRTDNALDMSISGRGFFQILQADGTIAYTRDGSFQLDLNGNVVNSKGLLLQPTITFPTGVTGITIGEDGVVSTQVPNSSTLTQLGTIQLADFINPAGLEPIGGNLFVQTDASGTVLLNNPQTNGLGSIDSGYLESSNVNVVEELVNLIQTQRAYEMNARALETVDDMLKFVVQSL